MPRSQPFVDWMKAAGLLLIVYGHVAHASAVWVVPPIYVKQLGVTFFLFASGFTLARESRPGWQVVVSRLFEVCLFGAAAALLVSAVSRASGGGLLPSNYLPLMFGANLFFDNFPANPTTWYLGTYMHMLVLWVLALRGARIEPRTIAVVVGFEIAVRAFLVMSAGPYVAYMALTNWTSVLLLGLYCGAQRHPAAASVRSGAAAATARLKPDPAANPDRRWALALAGFVLAWSAAARLMPWRDTFPFMSLAGVSAPVSALASSACASLVYLTITWLMYRTTLGFGRSRVAEFVARNTVVVFIIHMPVYYWTRPLVEGLAAGYWPRVVMRMLICLVALLIVSELIHRVVDFRRMRNALVGAIAARLDPRTRLETVARGA